MTQNDPQYFSQNYHTGSRIIHWLSAVLILGLLLIGFWMVGMEYSPFKLEIYGLHKSFGLTILFLAFLRMTWRIIYKPPAALNTHKQWEKALSKTIHIVLYISLFAMPVSGWVMSSAGDYPTSFFGLFDMPKITPKNADLFELGKEIHEILAFIVIGCVGLHILGALKHHMIDKDATLTRMGGHPILGILALIILAVTVLLIGQSWIKEMRQNAQDNKTTALKNDGIQLGQEYKTKAQPYGSSNWLINSDKSKIGFEYKQYGSTINGEFADFDGEIIFNPDDLKNAKAIITINTNSIATGSADRDEQALGAEWFNVEQFQIIRFESREFKNIKDNQYEVTALLSIRDVELPISFPFTLNIKKNQNSQIAEMRASLTLNRLDYGVGQGQWEATDAIENAINIHIEITATR